MQFKKHLLVFIVKIYVKYCGYKNDYSTVAVLNYSPGVPLSFLGSRKTKLPSPTVHRQNPMVGHDQWKMNSSNLD